MTIQNAVRTMLQANAKDLQDSDNGLSWVENTRPMPFARRLGMTSIKHF